MKLPDFLPGLLDALNQRMGIRNDRYGALPGAAQT
jgi:hypothetical protein